MRSVTCSSCGFVSWADGGDCKQCGKPLSLKQPLPRPLPGPSHTYEATLEGANGPAAPGSGAEDASLDAQPKRHKGHAVASLVIGIFGFFTLGLLLIGTIVGTALGLAALKKAGREPARYGGRGLAIAGIVLNIGALVMVVPMGMVAAVAIPNVLAARQAANEASALRIIRVVTQAEQVYQSTNGGGEYGELSALVSDGLLEPQFTAAEMNGYHFTLVNNDSDFEFSALPIGRAGRRSFLFSSEDWQIHVRTDGQPATIDDPTLEAREERGPRPSFGPRPVSTGYNPSN